MVRVVNNTRFHRVIVAAEEISPAAHAHVGGGDGDVGVKGKVVRRVVWNSGFRVADCGFVLAVRRDKLVRHFICGHAFAAAFGVVHAIVISLTQRILAHRAARVIGHVINIRREKTLIGFVNACGNVCPPKKGLHKRRSVVGAHLDFKICASWMHTDPVHAFHACHWIVVAAPDGLRAVGVFFDVEVHRQERRGPMMLRPVEFDATGNPRPGEAHERRLDHWLMIDCVVAVCFVLKDVDASANFRQHHRADEFILNPHSFPFAIHWLFRDPVREWQRVHFAAAALINAFLQKHWVLVWHCGQIRWNHQVLHAHAHT